MTCISVLWHDVSLTSELGPAEPALCSGSDGLLPGFSFVLTRYTEQRHVHQSESSSCALMRNMKLL